jgi:hypothetical protein
MSITYKVKGLDLILKNEINDLTMESLDGADPNRGPLSVETNAIKKAKQMYRKALRSAS